jgi:hypothetical protein
MSRLDLFIERAVAQRACLGMAVGMIAGVPGPVLELGLGNGRTYDHLRCILPNREIFVFDRKISSHPDCVPDRDHMILGDIQETLPSALGRIGAPAALVHSDVGSFDAEANKRIAQAIGRALPALLAPGAVVVAYPDMDLEGVDRLALPDGVTPGRYFMYRRR